jgi:hypothetical protein
MRTFRYTLQDLVVVNDEVVDSDGKPFDRVAYSRFKYGYLPPALEYGQKLAALIADALWTASMGRPIYIVSAPYKYLPTASHHIARALCAELGRRAARKGLEPPVLLPFHKAAPGTSAYAKSSEEERLKLLTTIGLRLDESLIPGSHVLVVDDIRITGTAEKVTAAYLELLHPEAVWYLHAARLPENIGKVHPGLEDELNQTIPHTLDAILEDVWTGQFRLNTRVLRTILESGDPAGTDPMGKNASAFKVFLGDLPTELLQEIHEAAVGSGVKYYQTHEHNLNIVWTELEARDVLSLSVQ